MLRRLLPIALLLLVLAPVATAEVSLGYAYLKVLEDNGGNVPLGFYLSAGRSGEGTGLELDLGYHRKSADSVHLNTFTALAGPRVRMSSGGFFHLLGGVRHDRLSGESNTAFGGAVGLGTDLASGGAGTFKIRLGADFQMFFDNGEKLKTLRLNAGITF